MTLDYLRNGLARRDEFVGKKAVERHKREEKRNARGEILLQIRNYKNQSSRYGAYVASLIFILLALPSALGVYFSSSSPVMFVFLVLICASITPFISVRWLGRKVARLLMVRKARSLELKATFLSAGKRARSNGRE